MKFFKQGLLLSTFLAVPFHTVHGMKEEKDTKFHNSLSKRFANNTDKETLNGIRKSIENQIIREEKAPKNPICVDALFLGPHAENAELFKSFIKDALNDHLYWRRSFHPEDPFRITEAIKNSSDFLKTKDSLAKNLRLLLAELKKYSNPLFSFRYQAHMYWEMTIPSLVGYIATILYNPNNVAFEGSPVTMCLEEQVAKDLCKMVGYSTEELNQENRPLSWGHLTGGGTIANTEALWVARNIKFFPFSIQQALKKDSILKAAEKVEVTLPDGKPYSLTSLDPWTLLNLTTGQFFEK
jgi:hypothetical protein